MTREGYPHQPALTGLRAIAVAAVLAYHAPFAWMPGGFLGVDVFMVLSGYLITGLLLAEHDGSGAVRVGGFWSRRFRRLLPALLLCLVGVVLFAVFVAGPIQRT